MQDTTHSLRFRKKPLLQTKSHSSHSIPEFRYISDSILANSTTSQRGRSQTYPVPHHSPHTSLQQLPFITQPLPLRDLKVETNPMHHQKHYETNYHNSEPCPKPFPSTHRASNQPNPDW
ncbi:hypothetical protein KC19_1G172900 [Ceratodon purpureus]|uniref:Uncharacterized protein n=1 Tax=Ceratodon purpureus TaxID=3225 RepID=A0A8T0J9H8_CERPU|nr:hypothetical protein KC19_1G172900 [Ceratodon purpureus]